MSVEVGLWVWRWPPTRRVVARASMMGKGRSDLPSKGGSWTKRVESCGSGCNRMREGTTKGGSSLPGKYGLKIKSSEN